MLYHHHVVPVPFRDSSDIETLGAAAFLKIEPVVSGTGFAGALFLVNARGEPLEFAYNRVETPDTFLWRGLDLRRHAERKLATSLFTVCARTPRLLFCLAHETGSELFCQDLQVSLPVGRIGDPLKATPYSAAEEAEVLEGTHTPQTQALHLFWFPHAPAPDSAERQLLDDLHQHGLLLEPFERAALGLREVYPGELAEMDRR